MTGSFEGDFPSKGTEKRGIVKALKYKNNRHGKDNLFLVQS